MFSTAGTPNKNPAAWITSMALPPKTVSKLATVFPAWRKNALTFPCPLNNSTSCHCWTGKSAHCSISTLAYLGFRDVAMWKKNIVSPSNIWEFRMELLQSRPGYVDTNWAELVMGWILRPWPSGLPFGTNGSVCFLLSVACWRQNYRAISGQVLFLTQLDVCRYHAYQYFDLECLHCGSHIFQVKDARKD